MGNVSEAKAVEDGAARLGMRVTPIWLQHPADIEPGFKRGAAIGAHAYMVAEGGVINTLRQVIADRVRELKVPAIAGYAEYVEAGGLMSYSASFRDNFRRAAGYVDKIFKGAKPGDLPIEQPSTKYIGSDPNSLHCRATMPVGPPCPDGEQHATRDTRDGDGLNVRRRRAEGVAGIGD